MNNTVKSIFDELLEKGKANGSLTLSEIAGAAADHEQNGDELEQFYKKCGDLNIEIIDDLNIFEIFTPELQMEIMREELSEEAGRLRALYPGHERQISALMYAAMGDVLGSGAQGWNFGISPQLVGMAMHRKARPEHIERGYLS